MIVLSAGMPKAGTGWFFNMTNHIMALAGHENTHELIEKYRLQWLLKGHNARVDGLGHRTALPLMLLHMLGHRFTIKSHMSPHHIRSYLRPVLKMAYIYRDPRDVALSVLDNGKKMRRRGNTTHPFAQVHNLEDALTFAQRVSRVWYHWQEEEEVFITRYEDLKADTHHVITELCTYIGLGNLDVTPAVEAFKGDKLKGKLHLNKGIANRYREEMPEDILRAFDEHMGDTLKHMGYPLYAEQ